MRLITHGPNLRYLTNFTGSKGFLLIGKEKNYFVTDSRYIGFAQKLLKQKTRINFEVCSDLESVIKKCKIIEFEADHLTINQLKKWEKKFDGIKFKAAKKLVEELRTIKEPAEVKLLRKSQELNKKAFSRIQKLLKPGVKELEIAWQIKVVGHELGAEDISFEPIVAFGSNSAIPHHQNSDRRLKENDTALIDMGLKYKGYCSDLSRTMFFGKTSLLQQNIYNKVDLAQKAAIATAKPGVTVAKLDRTAKKEMGEHAEFFTHALGHGLGLEIHEAPRLSTESPERLKENMVITVEPGLYLPGKFGVRIEDMILIKKDGVAIL